MRMFVSRTVRTQGRRRPRLVLSRDRQRERPLLTDVTLLPATGKQVEAEITAKRFFDHPLAFTLPRAGGAYRDCPQHFLVDGQRRPHFRHDGIFASRST